ncbi:MAG: zf-HC2 domain-containing protein, partial [Acidobacteria bacterium]|nr:zf-HC2 domain-containing protein [Acidobacteriota bacterium]
MTDSHDHIGDQLSDYIDGELVPQVHAEIDRHLASCAECRSIADELGMVKARAAALASTPPQEDLWDGIAARITRRRR